jgi:hypothetical protein
MKKIMYISALVFSSALAFGQQPYIEFGYGAAGNRISRTLITPPPLIDKGNGAGLPEKGGIEQDVLAQATENSTQGNVSLYPNPTKNELEISLGDLYQEGAGQVLELIDLAGKVVHISKVTQGVTLLQLSGLRSGLYYVHFKQQATILESWKVVKID